MNAPVFPKATPTSALKATFDESEVKPVAAIGAALANTTPEANREKALTKAVFDTHGKSLAAYAIAHDMHVGEAAMRLEDAGALGGNDPRADAQHRSRCWHPVSIDSPEFADRLTKLAKDFESNGISNGTAKIRMAALENSVQTGTGDAAKVAASLESIAMSYHREGELDRSVDDGLVLSANVAQGVVEERMVERLAKLEKSRSSDRARQSEDEVR